MILCHRGHQKKEPSASLSHAPGNGEGYSLEAFHDGLRDLCSHHLEGDGHDRSSCAKDQAQQALALAGKLGLLKRASESWESFRSTNADLHFGTERAVESDEWGERMAKVTIPANFGLVSRVLWHPVVNLRNDPELPKTRPSIEFVPATPLEYLARWIAANDVFGDDVKLTAVIQWADGQVSFAISQPQYHGEPATPREIDEFFEASGWKRFVDSSDHILFYNYAFRVLAIDALPRNCYVHDDSLLPFDVILCHPDEDLESLLQLYPA